MQGIERLILTGILGLAMVQGVFAQSAAGRKLISIGLEAGLPLATLKDNYDAGLGGSFQYVHPFLPRLSASATVGYTSWVRKSIDLPLDEIVRRLPTATYLGAIKTNDPIGTNTDDGLIPLKLGLHYYAMNNLYGFVQTGIALSTKRGGHTSFAYAPGLGYSFPISASNFIDLSVRWEGMTYKSINNSFFGLRLAYAFGLGGSSIPEIEGE